MFQVQTNAWGTISWSVCFVNRQFFAILSKFATSHFPNVHLKSTNRLSQQLKTHPLTGPRGSVTIRTAECKLMCKDRSNAKPRSSPLRAGTPPARPGPSQPGRHGAQAVGFASLAPQEYFGIPGDSPRRLTGAYLSYADNRILDALGTDIRQVHLRPPTGYRQNVQPDGSWLDEWGLTHRVLPSGFYELGGRPWPMPAWMTWKRTAGPTRATRPR